MEQWYIKNNKKNFDYIKENFNISSFMARILSNRNISTKRLVESYLNPSLKNLNNPKLLKDIDKAISLIIEAINNNERIRIIGDYDVDGIMSTYILVDVLSAIGGRVDYEIPDRIQDGYGINKKLINKAKEDEVSLIITCDNGIAAVEEIEYLKTLNMNIVVTDHHDLPYEESNGKEILVQADAIINPKRRDCKYPFKKLCGAGVSYKLLEGLFIKLNLEKERLESYLQYVAFATICDVVDLIDENRIIVKYGLELLNETSNKGMKELIELSDLSDKNIGVYQVGFILGPCFNAAGRIGSASYGVELLLASDQKKVKSLAKKIFELNIDRKEMTELATEKLVKKVENSNLKNDKVLVIYDEAIHESIAGIVAGRIKDKYNKPTIVLTKSEFGLKGSARSIDNFNIFEELNKRKKYLIRFGGHPAAAGLLLKEEFFKEFKADINDNDLTKLDLIPKKYIDSQLKLENISFDIIKEINYLEPFGKGNKKPIFADKEVSLSKINIIGKNKNVLKIKFKKDFFLIEGILFKEIDKFLELLKRDYGSIELDKAFKGLENKIKLDIIYYPTINEFLGKRELQVVLDSYRTNL